MRSALVLLFTILFLCACKAQPPVHIGFNHPQLVYEGRVGYSDSSSFLSWPGNSVEMCFEGAHVAALLKDNTGDDYYYVILDGKMAAKIRPDTIWKEYTLVSGIVPGKHTLQLFKLTESRFGQTEFKGFVLHGHTRIREVKDSRKRIEFYGNSITAGYSADDITGDSGKPEYENNYYTYAALTARHYHAHYTCIAKSGIGLMISWYPIIMPEMFDRLYEADTVHKWPFTGTPPAIVVVDLLQNDSWLVKKKDHPQFRARFGSQEPQPDSIVAAYAAYISKIRAKYADATIICTLGSMDASRDGSPWPGYVRQAITQLHDKRILFHPFPYQGVPGHPKRAQHEQMAEQLIRFIDSSTIKW